MNSRRPFRSTAAALLVSGALIPVQAAAQSSPPVFADWTAVVEAAQGTKVYFNAWAGDAKINAYLEWVAAEVLDLAEIELIHVKVTDTAEVVARIDAEQGAGRTEGGSVDLIWINGENFAAMKARGQGVIINVTGLAAERTDAGYIAGSAGNAGLNAFTRTLGSRSLGDGIRVLAVSPGAVATERLVGLMRTRAEAEFGDPERWQGYLANLPLSRAAAVIEVADVVTFLASGRAAYMSGSVVTVDGGHGANMGSFT